VDDGVDVVLVVQDYVPELVGECSSSGCWVHVDADVDGAFEPMRNAVGAVEVVGVWGVVEGEPGLLHLGGQAIPEARRCLSLQEGGDGRSRDRFAGSLGDVPDVGGADPDHASLERLAGFRLLALVQSPPRPVIGHGDPLGDGGEDLIAGLALVDAPPQGLPLLEPGDMGRVGVRNAPGLVSGSVLLPDEQRVVERPAAEPCGELDCAPPVVATYERLDGAGQLLV
jgi:hypothetical protein